MEINIQDLLDILKVFVGPVVGFIAAYYFNIFQIKRREAAKRNMLQYILKESTFELSDSIDETSKSLKYVMDSLQSWIAALHNGVINYASENGDFSVVKKVYNLDDMLDNSMFDGIFDVTVYSIHNIEVASEMMKLSFLKPTDYKLTSLALNLERSIKDYNSLTKKLHEEIDDLRKEVISYVDGVNKIGDLEKNIKSKNSIIVSMQRMRNYVAMNYSTTLQLQLILEEISSLIASSILSSQAQGYFEWFRREKNRKTP